jgi:hypothetical protein
MPITRSEAKDICTKPEFELVESSFSPAVKSLSPARLKSKIGRARKLQDKYRDLARKQNRETKGSDPSREAANKRTEQKATLFDETRERFEAQLGSTGGG